jgi:hypothetical protein
VLATDPAMVVIGDRGRQLGWAWRGAGRLGGKRHRHWLPACRTDLPVIGLPDTDTDRSHYAMQPLPVSIDLVRTHVHARRLQQP